MEQKYTLTIDPTTQLSKPTKKQCGIISNNLKQVVELSGKDIAKLSAKPFSYTFSPGVFDGLRSNTNWTKQQVFMLDFDNGVKPQVIIDKLAAHEIFPNIIYFTLRHTEDHPRFRIVIFVEEPINDYHVAQKIRQGLIKGFPECDKKCVDAARFYLGGHKSEELNIYPNRIEQLVLFASLHIVASDKQQTRNLQKFGITYNTSNRNAQISAENTNSQIKCTPRNEYVAKQKNVVFNYDLLKERLKVFNDFVNGKELKYVQLFGLVTNLIHAKGGEKYLKDIMNRYNKAGLTAYKPEDFAIIPVCKQYDYLPQKIDGFSPYPEDHRYTDVFDVIKTPRGVIQVIEPVYKIKLSEAEKMLDYEFSKVLKANDNKIYIIKTQTAIGKSSKLLNLKNTTLAFPTHKLKNEISDKMEVDYLVVPQLPVFSNRHINEKIEALYRIGLNNDVFLFLNKIAFPESNEYTIEDCILAKEFLQVINDSKTTTKTVLTTHLRGLFDPYSHETIIFDEDPINSLISIKKFELSDLFAIKNHEENKEDITQIIDIIEKTKPGVITKIYFNGINCDKIRAFISEFHSNSNLIQFFSAKAFYKDKNNPNMIHYLIQNDIPKEKKVIILSATPQLKIYKEIYGDRVNFIDSPLAESQGKIKQFIKNGYSRSYLKNNEVPGLIDKIGEKCVITFKKFKSKFSTAHNEIHYGNCQGYDILKGKDLAIVGTPHQNELKYFFMAFAMGVYLKPSNCKIKNMTIDYNGFRFLFSTYENETLRKIQLGIIEAELVQAVGRARSLRTNAEVLVFSNLPLLETTSFE